MKVGIFAIPEGTERWIISACEEMGVDYEVIDLFGPNWVEEFRVKPCDGYVLRPAAYTAVWRNVYLRRLYLLRDQLEGRCVPTLDSILYYESKILMADLFRLANIPHPKTEVFFRFSDAWACAATASFPLIVKTDGGSGAWGVTRIHTRAALRARVIRAFLTRYVPRGYHSIYDLRRVLASLVAPWRKFFRRRDYLVTTDSEQGYLLVQDAVDIAAEWRIVVIGKSYFGHQKALGKNKLHSGSGKAIWVPPPFHLLDRVRGWCESLELNAMTFDIFEDAHGDFLVNEMQAIMGAYAPSQMYIDGVPGRYVRRDEQWVFEEGEFCRHACDMLRIETLLEMLQRPAIRMGRLS